MAYATLIRRPPLRILRAARVALFLRGCFAGAHVLAATQTLTPSDDTFINSHNPNNNNGGSASVFTGTDGLGGLMRGLIRFEMPAALAGRATVTGAQLKMTTQALGNGAAGTAATESLRAVAEPWIQGNGVGNASTTFTVGQACGGLVTGATWNQSNCTTVTNWSTAGASGAAVSATESGSAAAPALIGAEVTWNSPGMTVDVQAWIDTPAGNHGWRISSSTEGNSTGLAQRFFSAESGASGPSLTFTYDCKSGFLAAGTACTTCSVAANSSCAVAQGNACIDSGPPSTTYACACNNPVFVPGIDGGGNPVCARVTLDIDGNGHYDALTDGLLIIRHLFGLTGTALTAGAIGAGAMRTDPAIVAQYLANIHARLDIDGDTQVDPQTDGLLLLRYLFGLRGPSLIDGATAPGATRSGPQIESYIQSLMP